VVSPARLLLVDDDQSMCELLHARLTKRGFETRWLTSAAKALVDLRSHDYDVVITDVHMREMDGLEFCDRVVSNCADTHVIVMTADSCVDAAVAALRARAHDFLVKPVPFDQLVSTIESACKFRKARAAQPVQRVLPGLHDWADLVGASEAMDALRTMITQIANVETSIVITGESGTGKELVARAIHQRSGRGKGPFVAFNCAAIPGTLMDAELFGHAKGAFTDARIDRAGLFAEANGGVLFLDEIGELPLHLQPKLLRALQERSARPLGGNREVLYDVRIVAATNRNLEKQVKDGLFREDLYYRLNVIQVHVPPLRERDGDVLLCAQHFVEKFARACGKTVSGINPSAAKRLLQHSWPGNVRELQNAIERAVVLTRSEQISVEDLPEHLRRYNCGFRLAAVPGVEGFVSLEQLERAHIMAVMKATGGNRTAAAEILGVDRRTLLRKEAALGSKKN
jgi:two-component system, NtrC family, response regulator AtoC